MNTTAEGLCDQVRMTSNLAALRPAAYQVIRRTDGMRSQHQILGAALAAIVMAEEIGLPPEDLFRQASRMLADVDGPFTTHIRAMRQYVRGEFLGEVEHGAALQTKIGS